MGSKGLLVLGLFVMLLAGCLGKAGTLESMYGSGLSSPAKYCMSESGDSDQKFYECIVSLAIGIDNSSLCEEVFSESPAYQMGLKRDSCLFRFQEVGGAHEACAAIRNESIRNYCTASSSHKPEECLSLGDASGACVLEAAQVPMPGGESVLSFSCRALGRDTCLLSVAAQSGNSTACEMIRGACNMSASNSCRSDYGECYSRVAEETGDSSVCRNLGIQPGGAAAYDSEKAMADCSMRAFNSSGRLSSCSSLPGKEGGECLAKYAVSSQDPSICQRIASDLRDVVKFPVRYSDYAAPNSDWSAFTVSKIHDECLSNLAIALKRPSICRGEFLVENGNSLCFFEAAISLNDSSLCSEIEIESTRASCLSQLSGKPAK